MTMSAPFGRCGPPAQRLCGDAADALGTRLHPLTPADLDEAWPASGELAVDELRFRIWRTPGHSAGSVRHRL